MKTTDAYRLSLDTLADYRKKLQANEQVGPTSSILIVVGRQDTGELEAQIRGSRHAWDVRLVSAEALIKLVLLKENPEGLETGLKIRSYWHIHLVGNGNNLSWSLPRSDQNLNLQPFRICLGEVSSRE